MGRKKIDKSNWVCCVCGKENNKEQTDIIRYKGKEYCKKHLSQVQKHGAPLPKELERNKVKECCVCSKKGMAIWEDGNSYCKRHYLQMYRHGRILERTIYDKNEYIDHVDEGYCECILYDKDFNENGRTLIDLDKKEELQNLKIYKRTSCGGKEYAMINLKGGEKIFLHRYVMGIKHLDYKLSECVDHINGNSLDNRCCNLRICSHRDNMKNIRKGNKHVCGVKWLSENQKWTATIMLNYKSIHLGNYDEFEEAVYARIKKEQELFGEYGSCKDYYYILDTENPIEEIKKINFDKPQKTDRIVPLKQTHCNRKSLVGEKILSEINGNKEIDN